MKKLAVLLSAVALSLVVSCATSEPVAEAPKATPVAGKGTITALPKGAGFVIDAEGGKKYTITNADKLDKKVLKDKAKVEFSGTVSPAGDAIEVTTLK